MVQLYNCVIDRISSETYFTRTGSQLYLLIQYHIINRTLPRRTQPNLSDKYSSHISKQWSKSLIYGPPKSFSYVRAIIYQTLLAKTIVCKCDSDSIFHNGCISFLPVALGEHIYDIWKTLVSQFVINSDRYMNGKGRVAGTDATHDCLSILAP